MQFIEPTTGFGWVEEIASRVDETPGTGHCVLKRNDAAPFQMSEDFAWVDVADQTALDLITIYTPPVVPVVAGDVEISELQLVKDYLENKSFHHNATGAVLLISGFIPFEPDNQSAGDIGYVYGSVHLSDSAPVPVDPEHPDQGSAFAQYTTIYQISLSMPYNQYIHVPFNVMIPVGKYFSINIEGFSKVAISAEDYSLSNVVLNQSSLLL